MLLARQDALAQTSRMTIPQTMHAIEISEPGGPEVLRQKEYATPACNPGEVLIRVAAAGVNGPDLAQRRGQYAPPPGASPLPGLEVAGIIANCGPQSGNLAVGTPVMALTNGGGYADYVAVPHGQVVPIPEDWSYAEAAALPETWFTVIQTLVMRAGLAPGMTVLVHGASGGIGSAAIQICTIAGASAIAIVSSEDKAEYCTALGALGVIDRTTQTIVDRVMALTDGRGADRVVDVVGGAMAAVNVDASARGGHIVQISTLEGGTANLPLRKMMAKDLTLSGSTLRPQPPSLKAAIAARFCEQFLPALSAGGSIRPRITTFPLAEAAAAHRLMESRTHRGKLVLITAFGSAQSGT